MEEKNSSFQKQEEPSSEEKQNVQPDSKVDFLGVLSFIFCILGITYLIGLILGIISLVRISKSNGKLKGQVFPILGIASIVIWIPIACLSAIAIPNMIYARNKAILSSCSGNLRNLGIVVINYSTNHEGHYPQNLNVLVELGYIENMPRCPNSDESYIYEIGGWDDDSFTVRCPYPEGHIGNMGPRSQTAELYFTSGKGVIQVDN